MSLPQAGDQALSALYEQVLNQFSLGAQASQVYPSAIMSLNHSFPATSPMQPSPVQQLAWPMLPFGPLYPMPNPPGSQACAARPTWVGPVAQPLYGNPLGSFLHSAHGLLSACLMSGPDPVSLIKTLIGVLQAAAYMPAQQGAYLVDAAFAEMGGSMPHGALAALAQATAGRTSLGSPPAHGHVNPAAQLQPCNISGGSPPPFIPLTPVLPHGQPAGTGSVRSSSSLRASEPLTAPNVSPRAKDIAVTDVTDHSGSQGEGQGLGKSRSILLRLSGSQLTPQGTRPRLAAAGEMPPDSNNGRWCNLEETGLQLGPGGRVASGHLNLPRPENNWGAAVARLLLPLMLARLEVMTCGGRPASRGAGQGRMVLSMLVAGQSNLHSFLDSMAKAGSHLLKDLQPPTSGHQGLAQGVPKRRLYPLVRALSCKGAKRQALDHRPRVSLKGQGTETSMPMLLRQVKREPLDSPAGRMAGSHCPGTTVLHGGLIPLPVLRAPRVAQPRHHRNLSTNKASAEHLQPVTSHADSGSWQLPDSGKREHEARGQIAKAVGGLWHNEAAEKKLITRRSGPPLNGTAGQTAVPPRSLSLDMPSTGTMRPRFTKRHDDQRDSPLSKKQRLCNSGPSSGGPGACPSALGADHGASYPLYDRLAAGGPYVNGTYTCGLLKPIASRVYLREPNLTRSTSTASQPTTLLGGSQEDGSPKLYLGTLRPHGPYKGLNGVKKPLGKGLSHKSHLESCKSQNIGLLATAAVMLEKDQDSKSKVTSPSAAAGSPFHRANSGSAIPERRKYLGVGYKPKTRRWYAQIRNGKEYYWLGCNFTNPEDAARAYDRVARALRGPSTQPINFPLDPSDAIADMQMQLSDTNSSGGVAKLIGLHGTPKPTVMPQPYEGSGDQVEAKQPLTCKARPLSAYEPQDQDLDGDCGLSRGDDHDPSHTFTAAQQRRGTSRYRGVCRFNAKTGVARWKAQIVNAGQVKHLGYFATELDAARAFDRSAISLRGPLADVNFPHEV